VPVVRRVPIRVRGVDYPSITAAAAALNVAKSAVCHALDHGRLEKLGLPKTETTTVSVVVPVERADEIRAVLMRELGK
jgi:hypothetical protein